MNYNDFVCFVQTEMKEKLGPEVHVELHQITKNNSVVLDGLSICEGEGAIAPAIYLNDFYEEYKNGMTMPEIMEYIRKVYHRSRPEGSFDTEFYMDFDRVKGNLACKLINREKNKELLERVPYMPFLDLAVVIYYKLTDSELGSGTIQVYESHRKRWGITKETLFRTARENTLQILPEEFYDIQKILGEALPENQGEKSTPMYVLTNRDNYFGAVNIIFDSVLEKVGKKLREDFWILPSSIHECILVPASASVEREELENMVRQVNASEVAQEDFLSDNVYFYKKEMHRLR